MTREEKQLLIKELCARVPYGVIIHTWYEKYLDIKCTGVNVYTNAVDLDIPDDDDAKVYVDNVKPYLRPMSSMTEEEQKEFVQFHCVKLCPIVLNNSLTVENENKMIDWLTAHHFDFRGLIPMGLALEAPEDMY